jgi:hypothetical protein
LDWTYDKALTGIPGFDSAEDLADEFLEKNNNADEAADDLIVWQVAKASASGFLTGLGGLLTMPVTIPANIASVMYIQVRMVAAIAHLGGHNIHSDRVKTFVYVCLLGNGAQDILKDIGIVVGTKMANQAIKNISGKVMTGINKKVGFRLITKFGQKGTVNLVKWIPLLSGFIGGTFDGVTTKIIGDIAKATFITYEFDFNCPNCDTIITGNFTEGEEFSCPDCDLDMWIEENEPTYDPDDLTYEIELDCPNCDTTIKDTFSEGEEFSCPNCNLNMWIEEYEPTYDPDDLS